MPESQNPNALRDKAIELGKQAQTPEDFEAADQAFIEAGTQDITRDFRELAATNIFRGCLQARAGINLTDYCPDTEVLSLAFDSFSLLERNDQYRVNTIGRVSVLETLQGNRIKGFTRAASAIIGSVFSEANWRPYSNPDLSFNDRMKAKARAFVRGAGALAVTGLSLGGERTQRLTYKLADRVLK